jgi:hypothetical protein
MTWIVDVAAQIGPTNRISNIDGNIVSKENIVKYCHVMCGLGHHPNGR